MRWQYSLVTALAMQTGLLLSRAFLGTSSAGITFGDAFVNNLVVSLTWLLPLTVAGLALNVALLAAITRILEGGSSRRLRWWKGGLAGLLTGVGLVIVLIAGSALTSSLFRVTDYSKPTVLTVSDLIGHAGFLAWSATTAAVLVPLANRRGRAVTKGAKQV